MTDTDNDLSGDAFEGLDLTGVTDAEFVPPAPPVEQPNRFEKMKPGEFAAAWEAARRGEEVGDEPAPSRWDGDPEAFERTWEDAKQGFTSEDELNDENDPKGFHRWARLGLQAMRAGLDSEMVRAVQDGEFSLEEALQRKATNEVLGGTDQPSEMESLSDEQFARLWSAAKTGDGARLSSGVSEQAFISNARAWLAPEESE